MLCSAVGTTSQVFGPAHASKSARDRSGNGARGGKVRSNGGTEAPSEYDNATRVDVLPQRDRIIDR
ncbi:MAG TPA: hypothetical protein VGT81_06530 [Casimicrobiaceae bacterium]|nr:hypothetical protein [Casimicrobiaceae bacterium]